MYETVYNVHAVALFISVLCTVLRLFPIAIGGLILYSTSCVVERGGGGGGGMCGWFLGIEYGACAPQYGISRETRKLRDLEFMRSGPVYTLSHHLPRHQENSFLKFPMTYLGHSQFNSIFSCVLCLF